MFTWEDGRPFTPDYITKSFKKLVRSSEELDSDLKLHDLRASCVSILVHKGMDLKDVQKWVGHSDMQTTMNIYARTKTARQEKVANAMIGALFGIAYIFLLKICDKIRDRNHETNAVQKKEEH